LRIEREAFTAMVRLASYRLAEGDPGANRTLLIPVIDILNRLALAKEISLAAPFILGVKGQVMPPLPEASAAVLSKIRNAPTPGELGDIGFVEAIFRPGALLGSTKWVNFLCRGRFQETMTAAGWSKIPPLEALRRQPFFCPTRPALSWPWNPVASQGVGQYFDIPLSSPWADTRPVAINVEVLQKLAVGYPWPGIVRIDPAFWWRIEQAGLRKMVHQDGILTEDAARLWVTLSIVADWNRIQINAQKEAKAQARIEKQDLLITEIGIAVVGAILAIALGPLVAKGVALALNAISAKEKAEVARDLNDVAGQLRGSEPGFAKQLAWSAEFIQKTIVQAGEEAERRAEAGPAPEGAAAPAPAAAPPSLTGSKVADAAIGIGLPAIVSIGAALLR